MASGIYLNESVCSSPLVKEEKEEDEQQKEGVKRFLENNFSFLFFLFWLGYSTSASLLALVHSKYIFFFFFFFFVGGNCVKAGISCPFILY